jgi:hypothetical protein
VPDTGPPWNIPYADPTDLVRDWPQLSEDVADAVADGLDAAGGLVAVKHALFTGTQSNSTAAGANFAVTNLSITHEVADPSNSLIISAFFGAAADTSQSAAVGIAVFDGTNLLGVGDADGSRTRVTAGGIAQGFGTNSVITMPHITFVHTPGAGSKTYTVRAINIRDDTRTIFINRSEVDTDDARFSRTASALVIQEVKV